jgi:hypothetical protein
MELLDQILASESRLKQSDLMPLMVRHWMKIRDETKEDNTITCTTFSTVIAYILKIDISGHLTIPHTP